MNCEIRIGLQKRLSLVDGAVEEVHSKQVKEILVSIPQLPKEESKLMDTGVKRPFVPIGGSDAQDLLGR